MIVKLGNWARNPVVEQLCAGLLGIAGARKKTTPQRCLIQMSGETLASIGLENNSPVIEFVLSKEIYAEAHGAKFVRPHPLARMARDGWLQAKPETAEEADQVVAWVRTSIEAANKS